MFDAFWRKKFNEKEGDKVRKPKDSFLIRNINDFSGQEKENLDREMKEDLNENLEEVKESSVYLKDFFTKENQKRVSGMRDYVAGYFSNLGFSNVKTDPFYFVEKTGTSATISGPAEDGDDGEDITLSGTSINGVIELKDLTAIDDDALRNLMRLKMLGHEMYHATSKDVYSFQEKDKALRNPVYPLIQGQENLTDPHLLFQERGGASYPLRIFHSRGKTGGLLEEGLAFDFENRIFHDVILPSFPKQVSVTYHKSLDLIADSFIANERESVKKMAKLFEGDREKLKESLSFYYVQIKKNEGDEKFTFDATFSDYQEAGLVVKYLRERIERFDRLVEKMRIQGRTLDFARAVEKEFGTGAFARLTVAHYDDALAILEWLKSVRT